LHGRQKIPPKLKMPESVELGFLDVNTGYFTVSKPKKVDNTLFSRLRYTEKSRLYTYLYNVSIVNKKDIRDDQGSYSMLYLDANKQTIQKVAEIDDFFIDNVRKNVRAWFAHGLDESIIDEYYKRSIVMSTKQPLLKIKVQSNCDVPLNSKLDVLVYLKGLRFYKHAFMPEWEIICIKKVQTSFLGSVEDETNDDTDPFAENEAQDFDLIMPCEELDHIKESLRRKLENEKKVLSVQELAIQKKLQSLQEIDARLKNADLRGINQIADELETTS